MTSHLDSNWRKEVKAFREFTKQQQQQQQQLQQAENDDNDGSKEDTCACTATAAADACSCNNANHHHSTIKITTEETPPPPLEWMGNRRVIFPYYWVNKQTELSTKGLLSRQIRRQRQRRRRQVDDITHDYDNYDNEQHDHRVMIQEIPRSSAVVEEEEEDSSPGVVATTTDDADNDNVNVNSEVKNITSSSSSSCSSRVVSFDPQISVLEFRREQTEVPPESRWFTDKEIAKFKRDAIADAYATRTRTRTRTRVHLHQQEVVSKNKGLLLTRASGLQQQQKQQQQPFFDDLGFSNGSNEFHEVLLREIHSLLIVAPDKCILILMAKYVTKIMPHVLVQTALTTEEALEKIEGAKVTADESTAYHGYDIILIEEKIGRLDGKFPLVNNKSFSSRNEDLKKAGHKKNEPKLLRRLSSEQDISAFPTTRNSLLIGLSSTLSGLHYDMMRKNGADLVWGVPPPKMNTAMRDELLNALLEKRGKDALTLS
eukprot:CAMPEP_0116028620 /NCGR_PEP_ID=MMETSP0321-20121206/15545_1 /TAXON_ID=163516 /ORGANISM="Leptocylindrus danicus var. danicus, Strain B650" /LENGTH=485 /DNA_ID=CAMNT_0003502625 /DNA_START=18 /DNA_END=1475 /DNA_ORIENTATION=-